MTVVGFFSTKAMLVLIDCRAKIINDSTGSGKAVSPTTVSYWNVKEMNWSS